MSYSLALPLVIGVIAGTVVAVLVAVRGSERKQLLLQALIGVASTFAGVFLGLGLDKVKNDHEDRDLAAVSLGGERISFVEQMRPWHQDARKFPKIALTTPNPEQNRIFLETFKQYMSQTFLDEASVKIPSDPKIIKNFDELFVILMNGNQTKMKLWSRTVRSESASIEDRYRSFHRVLELSSSVYTLMCMQAALLSGEVKQDEFDLYIQTKLPVTRANQTGCFEPQWGMPALVNGIILRAARAGGKPFEQIQLDAE